nr:hypothetical protein [uncultured Carboxylicivirga sp.]
MRLKYISALFLIILITNSVVKAQHKYENWIHGKVIDTTNDKPVPNTQVGSYKRSLMFACDSLGEFKANFPGGDSLKVIALGYNSKIFYVDSLLKQDSSIIILSLSPIHYELPTVNVSGFKEFREYTDKLAEIREKQKELEFPSHIPYDTLAYIQPIYHHKPNILTAIFQPVNFIYYYTSPSERLKVKFLREMKEDKIRSRLTRDLVHQLTLFEGEELDNFLIYCNTKIHLTESDNEISITNKVMDLYMLYTAKKE